MKALFLGGVAASTAAGIRTQLPVDLDIEILDDPIDRARLPQAAADSEILVSNHWRAEYPPALKVRLVQSVATGVELIEALCTALGPETTGLIDARRLSLMRPDALLINIARGQIVDEDAIYWALHNRTIAGAALDVWWQYPNATEPERRGSRHPFHELPNVIATPHNSGWTDGMVERRWNEIADNINRFVRGESLINIVPRTERS